jgi:multidrug resistance efflux pump
MARKPNYSFERQERDRAKANKLAQKADLKRAQREQARAASDTPDDGAPTPDDHS